MSSRVFLLEDPRDDRIDVSLAEPFGEVVTLWPARRDSIWSETYYADSLARLRQYKFDPERDYFLVCGIFTAVTLMVGMLVSKYGSIRLLLYYPVKQVYLCRTVGNGQDATADVHSDQGSERTGSDDAS